jgi:hypothetical protein
MVGLRLPRFARNDPGGGGGGELCSYDKPEKSEILNNIEIQKPKVKNQNDNSKWKTFDLCLVILQFHFCILKGFVWGFDFGIWTLSKGIATLRSQ